MRHDDLAKDVASRHSRSYGVTHSPQSTGTVESPNRFAAMGAGRQPRFV